MTNQQFQSQPQQPNVGNTVIAPSPAPNPNERECQCGSGHSWVECPWFQPECG